MKKSMKVVLSLAILGVAAVVWIFQSSPNDTSTDPQIRATIEANRAASRNPAASAEPQPSEPAAEEGGRLEEQPEAQAAADPAPENQSPEKPRTRSPRKPRSIDGADDGGDSTEEGEEQVPVAPSM
ncbi:MAG: hypothetical protein HJJLKODD_02565 [Phycisphaerae bacterium]|nr:hypothetical protein [Phycisphaerae bacterium]